MHITSWITDTDKAVCDSHARQEKPKQTNERIVSPYSRKLLQVKIESRWAPAGELVSDNPFVAAVSKRKLLPFDLIHGGV